MQNSLLEEKLFDDGKQKICCWKLMKIGNQYTDTVQDPGAISLGKTESDGLNRRYILEAPVKEKVRHIKFEEWLYLVDKDYLLDREKMNKFGFTTGKIVPYIRKISNEPKYPFTTGRTINL